MNVNIQYNNAQEKQFVKYYFDPGSNTSKLWLKVNVIIGLHDWIIFLKCTMLQ